MTRPPRVPLLALFAATLLAPAAAAQAPAGAPPLPPPGRMVDLGGWRLHLHCTGERRAGEAAVILEAGAGGFSVDWSLVQPEASRFARVCSYDRAGLGWSELGPHPRTLRQGVGELRALLERAGEPPPYVLVGHSYGGMVVRLYTFTHPSDVVGLVLDESGHERGTQVLRDGRLVRLVETATGRAVPEVRSSGALREAEIPPAARAQIEAAARAMAPRAVDGSYGRLPEDARRMRSWSFGQVKHWASNDNPFEPEELVALLDRWTRAPYPLGDLPVVVLSRGRAEGDAEREEAHRRDQAELLLLSRSSRQVIAERSGHGILVEQPELVVAAIREVLAATQR